MPPYHPGPGYRRGNRQFGFQIHPITKKATGHKGDDWPAPAGTPIRAAYGGTVKEVRHQYNATSGTGWGWYVLLEHSIGGKVVLTRYAHMQERSPLAVGSDVSKDQPIGKCGSTGGSTGPHLHFEVIVEGTHVAPSTFDFPDAEEPAATGDWAYPFEVMVQKDEEPATTQDESEQSAPAARVAPVQSLPSQSAQYQQALANAESGAYPVGANGIWHGGIHFDQGTGGTLQQDAGVRCIANGEVIAYRVNGNYPSSQYSTGEAEYSSGFALLRHTLTLPPAPKPEGSADTDPQTANGTPTEPSSAPDAGQDTKQEETLTFYSLYMHLAHLDAHEGEDRRKPAYWDTPDNRFRVGRRAVDPNPFDTTAAQKGIRIRQGKGSSTPCIGWLPPAAVVTVEEGRGAWRKILSIDEGTLAAAPDQAATSEAPHGWVYTSELDKVIVGAPASLDAVVIPETPVRMKAGDFIGYPGQYRRRRDAGPFCAVRPLVHLEVFTTGPLEAFIEKSRARAAELPDTSRNILLVQEGAKLAQPLPADQTIAATESAIAEKPVAGAKWVQVRKGAVQTLPRSALGRYSGDSTRIYGGQHHLLRILDAAGNGISLAEYNALDAAAKAGYTDREVMAPAGEPIWVEASRLRDDRVSGQETPAWSRFPLQAGNGDGPVARFPRAVPLSDLDPPVTEADGTRWWQVEVAGEDGNDSLGWAREKEHDKVRLCTPWDWPAFDITRENTSTDAQHAHSLESNDETQAGENFKATADAVDGSPLFQRLRRAMDLDGKDGISREELRQALRRPALAQAISHLIVHYESEWGGDMAKWSALDPHMQGELAADWTVEKQRIEAMSWWKDVAGKHDFPGDAHAFHLHPIALINNFRGQQAAAQVGDLICKSCGANITLTEKFLNQICGASVKAEFKTALIAASGGMFAKYGVDTCNQVKHLLAQAKKETGGFVAFRESLIYSRRSYTAQSLYRMAPTAINAGFQRKGMTFRTEQEKLQWIDNNLIANDPGYGEHCFGNAAQPGKDFRGRGFIHLTHYSTYKKCADATGLAIDSNPELLESDYPAAIESALWFWKDLNIADIANSKDLSGDPAVTAVTRPINTGLKGLDDRQRYKREISPIFNSEFSSRCTAND